jgi:toxin-antitoxin system PIN domain toxin
MSVLLDPNVLIALVVADHVHHSAAESWFAELDGGFATCPITQCSLVRLLVRTGQEPVSAVATLNAVTAHSRHEFWEDSLPYGQVPMKGVLGHRQVTDAYLAQLARGRSGRLATFDDGLAQAHHDVVELVPKVPTRGWA